MIWLLRVLHVSQVVQFDTLSFSKDRRAVNIDEVDQRRADSYDGMLPRIASAFGVSEEAFVRATTTNHDAPACLTAVMQTSALMTAFEEITDPAIRQRCVDYVRTAARSDPKRAA